MPLIISIDATHIEKNVHVQNVNAQGTQIKSKNIYIPGNGIMFISYSHEAKHMRYIINEFKKGSLKIFHEK